MRNTLTTLTSHSNTSAKANTNADATARDTAPALARYTAIVCAAALLAGMTVLSTGCAVVRGQETTGAYIDDAGITTAVKAKMIEDKTVAASSISVETLNGTVQLSGFAKSMAEKSQAENLARNTKNVRAVRNDIVVRP